MIHTRILSLIIFQNFQLICMINKKVIYFKLYYITDQFNFKIQLKFNLKSPSSAQFSKRS